MIKSLTDQETDLDLMSKEELAASKFRYEAQEGLVQFGDPFERYLGYALMNANINQVYRIVDAFTDVLHEHAYTYRIWKKKPHDGTST